MQNKYRPFIEKLQNADFFTFKLVEGKVGKNYAKLLLHNLKRVGKSLNL